MTRIVVASRNPVKLQAVRDGFQALFGNAPLTVSTVTADSGVRDQPLTDAETQLGAETRARAARQALPDADYWVGIEGGIEETHLGMIAFAWVAVLTTERIGWGRTGTFVLPDRVAALVRQGHELGTADDLVFGRRNSKQENGAVGLLTRDVIDRRSFYTQAVILALIPMANPELYPPAP